MVVVTVQVKSSVRYEDRKVVGSSSVRYNRSMAAGGAIVAGRTIARSIVVKRWWWKSSEWAGIGRTWRRGMDTIGRRGTTGNADLLPYLQVPCWKNLQIVIVITVTTKERKQKDPEWSSWHVGNERVGI